MSWVTVDDMLEHLPLDVYDANGMVIRRAITGFDVGTGSVESFVLDRDGSYIEEPEGELKRRRETYPAPLSWKKITHEEAKAAKTKYWDLEGK